MNERWQGAEDPELREALTQYLRMPDRTASAAVSFLHQVAKTTVDQLIRTYDVNPAEAARCLDDPTNQVVHATRLVSHMATCAALTVCIREGSLELAAGAWFRDVIASVGHGPDSDVGEAGFHQLTSTIADIVGGNFSEGLGRDHRVRASFETPPPFPDDTRELLLTATRWTATA